MTLGYNQLTERPFTFYERYFVCTFCNRRLLLLTPMHTNLSLKLENLQKSWVPIHAQHYYPVRTDSDVANVEFCRKQNGMYFYRRTQECHYSVIFNEIVVFASAINLTIKPYVTRYYNFRKIPQLFRHMDYSTDNDHFTYSSPVLKYYLYPSIIYCSHLGRETAAETDMWIKYVPTDIWCLVSWGCYKNTR